MRIADQLTHNKDDFSLYLTDLNSNNFVIDSSGKVTIVDAEDIVVVDSRAVKSGKSYIFISVYVVFSAPLEPKAQDE